LTAPIYKDKLFGGLEMQYTSPRLTLSGHKVSGFAVTNFTLFSKNVFKGWEFSASVYNLFNNRYRDPGGEEHLMNNIRQDGLGFRVKALYRF
jgi:iron complex outermembrane receptor protein